MSAVMTAQFTRDRSAKLVPLYGHYRAALDALPVEGRFMHYRWWTFSDPLHVAFIAYSQMLGEYATYKGPVHVEDGCLGHQIPP
jgi:hypothetical protein